MIHGLDLFSGVGGLSLALEPWVRTRTYCESDPYAQAVLLSRMRSGSLQAAPIWDDICTLQKAAIKCRLEIIFGGFPCQDISVAGTGKGLGGKRSGLFFEMLRLIKEIRPPFVFVENVPAIRTRGGERVGKELAALGYDCRWDCISAKEVGAPHRRDRWFLLVADTKRFALWDEQGRLGGAGRTGSPVLGNNVSSPALANNNSKRQLQQEGVVREERERISHCFERSWFQDHDRAVSLLVHGTAATLDEQRALGNAVVPAQAREAFKRLMGIKEAA